MSISIWKKLSVSKKITLGSLLSLLPMLMITYIAFNFSSQASLSSTEVIQSLLVRNFSEKINGFLQKQAALFQEWTKEDIYGMALDFQELGEIREEVNNNLAAAPGMDLLMVTNLEGKVLYSSDPQRQPLETTLPWAPPLLTRPPGTVSLLPTQPGTSDPSLLFSLPAKDTNGQVNGLFLASIKWSAMRQEMEWLHKDLSVSGFPNASSAIFNLETMTPINWIGPQNALLALKNPSPSTTAWLANPQDIQVHNINGFYVCIAEIAQGDVFSRAENKITSPALLRLVAFIPYQDVHGHVQSLLYRSMAIALAGALLILIVALTIAKTITNPISNILDVINNLSKGVLTTRCPTAPFGDEIVHIGNGVNSMANSLETMIRSVVLETKTIQASLNMLTKTSESVRQDTQASLNMGMQSQDANQRIDEQNQALTLQTNHSAQVMEAIHLSTNVLTDNNFVVAAATEQASANVSTVALAAEEMSANIGSVSNSLSQVNDSVMVVANALDEMTQTMQTVLNRCQYATEESKNAYQFSQTTMEVMDRLSDSATDISLIIESVTTIAEEINMLALNAAIEAAGAGQAGRGFAVVAKAIKELAQQTGRTSLTIIDMVKEIQQQSQEVSASMEQLSQVIGRIEQVNKDIALAMDEQGFTLQDITKSIDSVAGAADEVTRNAGELRLAAEDVARAAVEASLGAQEIAKSTVTTQSIAQEVADSTQDANQRFNEVSLAVRDIAMASNEAKNLGQKTAERLKLNLQAVESMGELAQLVD
ncbi:MAG: methyl-accepting chemotaxis protein, partial [Magnetococcus sp. YQC-5]